MAKTTEKAKELRMFVEYETAEQALAAIQDYFQECDDFNTLYGEAGLAQSIKVSLQTLRDWYDGKRGEDFRQVAQWAYQEMASCFETQDIYVKDKVGSKKAWSLMKQPRFQGYQEKNEDKSNTPTVKIVFGDNMDASDFS